MSHPTDRSQVFRRLHQTGCFVIPNPWDVGSARVLAQLGFPALASSSAAFEQLVGEIDDTMPVRIIEGPQLDRLAEVGGLILCDPALASIRPPPRA